MGTGKSSLLTTLAAARPDHVPCYFDCTTKDLGDITIPNIAKLDDGTGYVTYLTNEELGAHNDKPIILMIDEFGKANPAVKNALLRLILERKIGSYTLHPDSIIFATTNLGSEGVGDLLPAHARNRITVVETKKPTAMEGSNGASATVSITQYWAGPKRLPKSCRTSAMYRIQMTTSTSFTPKLLIGLRSVLRVHYTQRVTSCNAVMG